MRLFLRDTMYSASSGRLILTLMSKRSLRWGLILSLREVVVASSLTSASYFTERPSLSMTTSPLMAVSSACRATSLSIRSMSSMQITPWSASPKRPFSASILPVVTAFSRLMDPNRRSSVAPMGTLTTGMPGSRDWMERTMVVLPVPVAPFRSSDFRLGFTSRQRTAVFAVWFPATAENGMMADSCIRTCSGKSLPRSRRRWCSRRPSS